MRWLVLVLSLLATPALAVEPDEILDDPVLEDRARAISAEVRCVVCQNEPIDSSNAGVARDLRILIRERLVAGDSDQEVLDFLVARYGDYVLFRPPFNASTYALWLGPFVIIGLGALGIGVMLARRPRKYATTDIALTDDEQAELERLRSQQGNDP
ncbi:MAG: cytochrome c-type biogenesis protein [Pseudomonadota bacterium]